jgi:aerobic carbon-monoxide dehydrogenase small subunit
MRGVRELPCRRHTATMASDEKISITIRLNGRDVRAEVEPRMLLVEFIREVAALTGTHVGCDTSYCGACTILLDGRAVKSCTVLAVQAADKEVRTVEDLASPNALNVLQACFSEQHALQCGFCTPGFLMSATYLLAENADPDEQAVRKALAGNVCRCTGYLPIIQAVQAAAAKMRASAS